MILLRLILNSNFGKFCLTKLISQLSTRFAILHQQVDIATAPRNRAQLQLCSRLTPGDPRIPVLLSTHHPGQNGRHFADDILGAFSWMKCFVFWFKLNNSLKFVWRGPIPTVNVSQKQGSCAGEASLKKRKCVQICLGGWLLTVDCIVYSDIFNIFNSPYLHSILSIAIIETPECQHCVVWQWAGFWARGNGKSPNGKSGKCDLNLSGK